MTESTAHSAADPAAILAPVDSSNRIGVLDALRGFALIGILLMNIEWFGREMSALGSFDTSLGGFDHATGWFVRCFVEGKFYKLFALLFGMGFAVMLMRAREKGRPFGAWFTRRMLVLLVIGILHLVFLWGGDILHDYAFAGLLLLGYVLLLGRPKLQRFDNPRSILKFGLAWASIPFVISASMALVYGMSSNDADLHAAWENDQYISAQVEERLALPVEEASTADADVTADEEERELSDEEQLELLIADEVTRRREVDAKNVKELEAFTSGSYWQVTAYRVEDALQRIVFTPFFAMLILMPVFLLGYWLIASGAMQKPAEHMRLFKPMAWIGMIFGMFLTVAALSIAQHPVSETSRLMIGVGQTLFFLGQYVLAAGYLGVIVLLFNTQRGARWLGALAPMGRMALTNYIMQSVILTSLFYGYGAGLFGAVSRAQQMLVVVAILVFQLLLSHWWLNRFRFGPLEWLWRSLTYLTLQPIRRAPAS